MRAAGKGQSRGQSLVEAALILPPLVVLTLIILQLTLAQQARLFTEYAAFCAARAGSVWNGSNERMRDAALFAVLPTLGNTASLEELAATRQRANRVSAALSDLGFGHSHKVPDAFRPESTWGLLRVEVVSPRQTPRLAASWKVEGGKDWSELDFDGSDTFPQWQDYERHFQLGRADPDAQVLRQANVLSLRLRYLYELKLPVANWILFSAWFALATATRVDGPLDRPILAGTPAGSSTPALSAREMDALWTLATRGAPGLGRRFFLPLTASYRIRMQSNFYRKWLMDEAG